MKNMKKNVINGTLSVIVTILLGACASSKKVAYIQNSELMNAVQSAYLYDARIMPKDVLTITVNTLNPEASTPFNLVVSPTINNNNSFSSNRALQTYLVGNDGTINFPMLGSLKVGGLTKAECEKLIHDGILPYMNANENPLVTVRMANYKISVLGEVARPGVFNVSNEKINIFEALAQAGDLTIYGVRDKVKLIRESREGIKEIHTLDLKDANIINSPYYYLQQNDIVYVEPNKVKARNSGVGQSTSLWLTTASIFISVASLLYNILK